MAGAAVGVVWPAPRPAAPRVLACLSFCGGGTAPFRPWARTVPADVDLALICYPGRERRIVEPAAQTWTDLMTDVLASIRSLAHRPYVLFGHSMGAWLAYEVAVGTGAAAPPRPQALVVSASNPPSRATTEIVAGPHADDTDDQLLDWMRRVGQLSELIVADPELREMALDLFRADRRATESYRFVPGRPVPVPVQVLHGADDGQVDGDAGWRELAGDGYRVDRLPGGHFYTPDVWAELPRRITAVVA